MPNRRIVNSGYAAMLPPKRIKSISSKYIYTVNGKPFNTSSEVEKFTGINYPKLMRRFIKSESFTIDGFEISREEL